MSSFDSSRFKTITSFPSREKEIKDEINRIADQKRDRKRKEESLKLFDNIQKDVSIDTDRLRDQQRQEAALELFDSIQKEMNPTGNGMDDIRKQARQQLSLQMFDEATKQFEEEKKLKEMFLAELELLDPQGLLIKPESLENKSSSQIEEEIEDLRKILKARGIFGQNVDLANPVIQDKIIERKKDLLKKQLAKKDKSILELQERLLKGNGLEDFILKGLNIPKVLQDKIINAAMKSKPISMILSKDALKKGPFNLFLTNDQLKNIKNARFFGSGMQLDLSAGQLMMTSGAGLFGDVGKFLTNVASKVVPGTEIAKKTFDKNFIDPVDKAIEKKVKKRKKKGESFKATDLLTAPLGPAGFAFIGNGADQNQGEGLFGDVGKFLTNVTSKVVPGTEIAKKTFDKNFIDPVDRAIDRKVKKRKKKGENFKATDLLTAPLGPAGFAFIGNGGQLEKDFFF